MDKIFVWSVVYDFVFESSSAGKRYSIQHKDQHGIILTKGDSLTDVCEAIEGSLDNQFQSRLMRLVKAEFLGVAKNSLEEIE